MADISRGQITIVDLPSGKSIGLYWGSNVVFSKVYNKENSTYYPNWSASPILVITLECYVTNIPTNQISRLKGPPTRKINGSANLAAYGATTATAAPYALKIKNDMGSYAQMHVECEVIYVNPNTTAETKARTSISYTKAENAGQLVYAIADAPHSTVQERRRVQVNSLLRYVA